VITLKEDEMAGAYITHWTDGKWTQNFLEEYGKMDLKGTERGHGSRITWLCIGTSGLCF
jgi:hypothetical protein